MTRRYIDIGAKVTRKRDGATATVINRSLATPSVAHPGIFGKTVLTLRLDDETLRKAAGGDQTGDLGWFVSYWK